MAKRTYGVRYHLLDEIRGFSVVCMVFFHAFFLLGYIFDLNIGDELYSFFLPAEPYFAGVFIFISGIASCLSRSNLKRGLKLAAVAVAINFITYFAKYLGLDIVIKFGILNLLAFCMLMAAALLKPIKKIPPVIVILLCAAVVVFTYRLYEGYLGFGSYTVAVPENLRELGWLYPLGIIPKGFASADYFPILPWSFIFFAGMSTGVYAVRGKFPQFTKNQHIRPLAFVGRHALIIYIAHQPVIYAIALAVQKIAELIHR